MAETKRCVRCSFKNPVNQIYCLKCGEYLNKNSMVNSLTIWNTTPQVVNEEDIYEEKGSGSSGLQKDDKVVVCPQCKQVEKIWDDIMPMACSNCGHSFEIGVDRIFYYSQVLQMNGGDSADLSKISRTNTGGTVINDRGDNTDKPKKKRKNDTTSLRLNVRTDPSILPQKINPAGDIIGLNGTVLKQLKVDSQVKIYRAPTGWYISVLKGDCVVEGIHMNKSIQVKLEHGNLLVFGKYQIFVEIME